MTEMVTVKVRNKRPICPSCGISDELYMDLVGTAVAEGIHIIKDEELLGWPMGASESKQEGLWISYYETDYEMEIRGEMSCALCEWHAPYTEINFVMEVDDGR